ncbi:MAG: phosphatase PAP2 family protein [Phyllobacteriaceae bacterium]|nr:phosphatase PAP2 family protein [Phyllobacteriaceae bacterium]
MPRARFGDAIGGFRRRLNRHPASHALRPATPALGFAAAFALVIVLAVMPFDEMVFRAVRASRLPALAFMRAITDVGKSGWYLVPAALLLLASAAADWSLRGRRGKARLARFFGRSAFLFAAIAFSGLIVNALKIVFGRSRPRLFDQDGAWHFEPFTFGSAHASFPSGHSTTMGAVAAVLFLWFPRWRWLTGPLGLFLAATRIPALAHYPSDVVAGFALGFFYTVYLARWLAARRLAFRSERAALLPRLRAGA